MRDPLDGNDAGDFISGAPLQDPADDTSALKRKAVRLELFTIAWMAVESVGAVTAGVLAHSIALTGFGLDSMLELLSALLVLRRLRAELRDGTTDEHSERRALRAIAVSFFVLSLYVLVESSAHLFGHQVPEASLLGIVITALALVVMPLLSRAKQRIGERLQNRLIIADAAETKVCALLSLATVVGVLLYSRFGWWWADPLASLAIVYFAMREGLEAWGGELVCDD